MDQDALNAIAYQRWKPLDLSWNLLPSFSPEHSWATAILSVDAVRQAYSEPKIIHYAGEKPWRAARNALPEEWQQLWLATAARTQFGFTLKKTPFWLRALRYVIVKAYHKLGRG